MVKLIVPLADHFLDRVTYRGMKHLEDIKKKFIQFGLLDRVKESPFKQFFLASEFNFSGVLVHQFMLTKIHTDLQNEVHFCLGTKKCRFGVEEFALVTGLNFGPGSSQAELDEQLKCNRLLTYYFSGLEKVKFMQLTAAFDACQVVDDIYKLGLCVFVEGVLNGIEGKLYIKNGLLSIVEDVELFFKYPWGKYSYNRLLGSCKKDMQRQRQLYEKKKMGGRQGAKGVQVYILRICPSPSVLGLRDGTSTRARILLEGTATRPRGCSLGL